MNTGMNITMRIALIDNYDSFTWNLFHLVSVCGATVSVIRNDQISVAALLARGEDAIILSPGPGTPNEAGICCEIIRQAGPSVPILGVCLGHQAIGQVYGGQVVRAAPMHGKVSAIHHAGRALFRGINGPLDATRYHSLVVERSSCPAELDVTAETEDGVIMALSHRDHPVHGVQFHPESILSEHGPQLIRNFLALALEWNTRYRANAA
jgi:anthranilate synthase component II